MSYDDPRWLATRHGLGHDSVDAVEAIAAGLQMILLAATGGPAS